MLIHRFQLVPVDFVCIFSEQFAYICVLCWVKEKQKKHWKWRIASAHCYIMLANISFVLFFLLFIDMWKAQMHNERKHLKCQCMWTLRQLRCVFLIIDNTFRRVNSYRWIRSESDFDWFLLSTWSCTCERELCFRRHIFCVLKTIFKFEYNSSDFTLFYELFNIYI